MTRRPGVRCVVWTLACMLACAFAGRAARAGETDASLPDPLDPVWTTPRSVVPSPVPPPEGPVMYVPPRAYRIHRAPFRPRGPVEVRDEWLLARPHLTLPAVSPDPVGEGRSWLRLRTNRGSDFGRRTGRFVVDGEHQTIEASTRVGLLRFLDVEATLPVHWRGPGFMDGAIDWFHELFGFKDNDRSLFPNEAFRVSGRTPELASWSDERGWGLGNLELAAHVAAVLPEARDDWRLGVIGRMALPTGTGPYDGTAVELGLQVAVARQVHPRWDVYAGVGGTFFSDLVIDGIRYEPWRAQGFLAVEYHVSDDLSIVVSTDAASRLVSNVPSYPATSWYVHLAAQWDIARGVRAHVGFTENLENQQGTVDFGVFLGFDLEL